MSVVNCQTGTKQGQKRLDEIALSLPQKKFTEVTLEQEKLKTVLLATIEAEIKGMSGQINIAIIMNSSSVKDATEIDYLITNKSDKTMTGEWIVTTFCQRNYMEKFYTEDKGWLFLKGNQMRHKTSLIRHLI